MTEKKNLNTPVIAIIVAKDGAGYWLRGAWGGAGYWRAASDGGVFIFFFVQAEDGIRDYRVTGVQTCALPIHGHGMIRRPLGIRSHAHGERRPRVTAQSH